MFIHVRVSNLPNDFGDVQRGCLRGRIEGCTGRFKDIPSCQFSTSITDDGSVGPQPSPLSPVVIEINATTDIPKLTLVNKCVPEICRIVRDELGNEELVVRTFISWADPSCVIDDNPHILTGLSNSEEE